MSSAPALFELPFVKKVQHTSDTYSLYFDRAVHPFSFTPGQYVRVVLPHENPDERGTSRFFTIASSPLNAEYLVITTKMMRSTFKHTMLQMSPGQMVQFWGPLGLFTLDEQETRPLVLLAGGIGMTPFHSMIAYAFGKKLQRSITFLVSFRTPDEFVYYQELTDIAGQAENISVIYTVTNPEASEHTWSGETGRINEQLMRKYVSHIQTSMYYICGPREMVEGTVEMLKTMQVPEEQMHIEKFTGYQQV